MRRRENTFRVDYANVPSKPTFEEIHEFVSTELGLTRDQVLRIQCSRSLSCAFVKVIDLAIAQRVVEEHGDQHEMISDGKVYPIKISMEDGAVDVKVNDLSEDVPDDEIVKFLGQYGEVISIHEQVWGENFKFEGIPTGIRIVRMMVKTNIPSYVVIDSEITSISFYGQRQTCRHCADFVHNGISCVTNKKLLAQKLAAEKTSYAEVTKPKKPAAPAQQQSLPAPPKLLPQRPGPSSKPVGPQQQKPLAFQKRNKTKKNDVEPPLLEVDGAGAADAIDEGDASDGSAISTDSKGRPIRRHKKQKLNV